MTPSPYADLVAAILRGLEPETPQDRPRGYGDLRQVFTVNFGLWDTMLSQLLSQLTEDTGGAEHGLALLRVPEQLVGPWVRGPVPGTQASVRWLASQPRVPGPDLCLRVVRLMRGDDYADLSESVRSFRLRGDGYLDPARLRPRYTVALRRSWLGMVGDLLGQVTADAGSYERAATVLGVSTRRLTRWVRWFVSRGSLRAARSTWPLPAVDEIDGTHPYSDLAAAVLRGHMVAEPDRGDSQEVEPLTQLQDVYRVRLAPWDEMLGDLLWQVRVDAGSIRKAAKVLCIPRSTLNAKLKRYRRRH